MSEFDKACSDFFEVIPASSFDLVEVELKTSGQVAYEFFWGATPQMVLAWADLGAAPRAFWESLAQAVLEACR